VACTGGTYKVLSGSADCVTCPNNSDSLGGSVNVADCKCGSGWTGLDGGMCLQCAAGKYKTGMGPADCDDCPENSDSPVESTAWSNCTLNVSVSIQSVNTVMEDAVK